MLTQPCAALFVPLSPPLLDKCTRVCTVVAFQVTLEGTFLSLKQSGPDGSFEHTDCVQPTATAAAGFCLLVASTALLLDQ